VGLSLVRTDAHAEIAVRDTGLGIDPADAERAGQRDEARALAARHGVPLRVVWCDAPDEVIAERLRRREEDAREVSDARLELLPRRRAQYASPAGEVGRDQSRHRWRPRGRRGADGRAADPRRSAGSIAMNETSIVSRDDDVAARRTPPRPGPRGRSDSVVPDKR
jgi:hypothetical protein